MRKTEKLSWGRKVMAMATTAAATILIGISVFTFDSNAQSAGKITGDAVNVRADASTTSEAIASKVKNDAITILGQKTGADGYTWYQIYINATQVGYVRSDLAAITDGTIPDTISADGTVTAGDASINYVNPVSGTVIGGQAVRVRQDASTSSTIVTSAASGLNLTILGTKDGTDSRTWYYVEFEQDGTTQKGFIRSDFIEAAGELVAKTEETDTPAPADTTPDTTEQPATTQENKAYDTELQGEEWYLLDYTAGQQYSITSIFDNLNTYNKDSFTKLKKKATTLRVWLIIFIIIAIAALAGAAFLFLKLREAGDMAAFAEADKERKAKLSGLTEKFGFGKSSGNTQKASGTRPSQAQGSRPAQNQGQRPNGARPAQGQGQRPMPNAARTQSQTQGSASGARPAGQPAQRPAQGQQAGTRPAGQPAQRPVQGQQAGARPAGQPAQRPVQGQQAGARPAGQPQQRPVQGQQAGARPAGQPAQRPVQGQPAQGSRPVQRPVMNESASSQPASRQTVDDDDEFEFGFLNWGGDDKK